MDDYKSKFLKRKEMLHLIYLQGVADSSDYLQGTWVYSQKIKNFSKKIVNLVSNKIDKIFDEDRLKRDFLDRKAKVKKSNLSDEELKKAIEEIEKEEKEYLKVNRSAVNQLTDVANMVDAIALMITWIEDKHLVGFMNDFTALCKKYSLPQEVIDLINKSIVKTQK